MPQRLYSLQYRSATASNTEAVQPLIQKRHSLQYRSATASNTIFWSLLAAFSLKNQKELMEKLKDGK